MDVTLLHNSTLVAAGIVNQLFMLSVDFDCQTSWQLSNLTIAEMRRWCFTSALLSDKMAAAVLS